MILRLGLILLLGIVLLVFVGSMLRLPEDGDTTNIDADTRCVADCTAAGSPSLNAFYDPRHAQCLCQAPGAVDDAHGYFLLGPRHD